MPSGDLGDMSNNAMFGKTDIADAVLNAAITSRTSSDLFAALACVERQGVTDVVLPRTCIR